MTKHVIQSICLCSLGPTAKLNSNISSTRIVEIKQGSATTVPCLVQCLKFQLNLSGHMDVFANNTRPNVI